METISLVWTEWLMVIVFVSAVIFWGFRMRSTASKSLEGSFLGGRKLRGSVASLSAVATCLSGGDFIGWAGLVYTFGVIIANCSLIDSFVMITIGLLLAPKLRKMNVYSLGGWLEKRYSRSVGITYSVVWCGSWMLFNMGLYIYGGALILHTLVGWPLYPSLIILTIIAASYTLLGGFSAVVATDVLQISLMFFPFLFISASVWIEVGNPAQLASMLPDAKAVFWTHDTPFGPLVLMILGIFFMNMSYWSTEAQILQRPIATRSEEEASISYLGIGFWLGILFPMLIVFPALAAIALYPDLKNPDHAMISLVRGFMPHGLYGVTVIGLMAGVFSSTDSQMNCFCTVFTSDLYKRLLRPNQSERHYLRVSKIAGVLFTLAAIGAALWISKSEKGMMYFAISVLATIMPPFSAIFIMGVLSRRANWAGALCGLVGGGTVAIILLVADKRGYLAGIADDTLYFRGMVAFLFSVPMTYFGSFLVKSSSSETELMREAGLKIIWTPKIRWMVIVLLLAVAGYVSFWAYFFR